MIVCIDTNVTLGMFGRSAPFLSIRQAVFSGWLDWAVSTEILLEYEEVFARELGVAESVKFIRFIQVAAQTRGVIHFSSPTFRFRAITADEDDNKFADCAIVAKADYVITSDRLFRALADAGYQPQQISPEEFIWLFLADK